MSQQGAALQNYNNELVKCTLLFELILSSIFLCLSLGIEDLCAKRDELQRQILIEEEDKHKLENELRTTSEKLARINENLAKKITARTEFDRTISETEAAYMKILESSQTLLNVLKRESHSLRTKVDE
jgi:Sjoegren syndrome nuclear autoantigen 1